MSDRADGVPAPNYTQVPNLVFELMADKAANMKSSELRVILAIVRKTFGWHKKRDKLSLTQLESLTSMSRQSVIDGIEAGMARGIVKQIPDPDDNRGGFFYELVISDNQSKESTSPEIRLVQKLDQSKNETTTSPEIRLELVQKLDTQKKGNKPKENGGGDTPPPEKNTPSGPPRHVAYLASKNVGAAHLFGDCDPDATIEDYDARRLAGWSNAAIVNHWKQFPPRPDRIFKPEEQTHAETHQQRPTRSTQRAPRPGERGYTGRS